MTKQPIKRKEVMIDLTKFHRLEQESSEDIAKTSTFNRKANSMISPLNPEPLKELDNPYPEDIFTEPKDWKKISKLLRDNGYSSDAVFGSFGRGVWGNCSEKAMIMLSGQEKEIKKKIIEKIPYILTYGLKYDLTEKEMDTFKRIFSALVFEKRKKEMKHGRHPTDRNI